jgi:hypothetical protein
MQVSPNPFTDNLNLQVTNAKRSAISIRMYTATGQVVFTKVMMVEKGLSSISLDNFQRLTKGVYFIEVKTDSQYINRKLLRQ